MGKENVSLDLQTIRAAVAGEAWAIGKVIKHYSGKINHLCTITKIQPDGGTKKMLIRICGKLSYSNADRGVATI